MFPYFYFATITIIRFKSSLVAASQVFTGGSDLQGTGQVFLRNVLFILFFSSARNKILQILRLLGTETIDLLRKNEGLLC